VVIAHEGPQGKAADYSYDFERQLFAAQGYTVLQVNHRGLHGHGAEFANLASWRDNAQDDVVAGVRWAIQRGAAEAGRVCLYGSGGGAGFTFAIAARTSGLFTCVIGVNGAYDSTLIDAGSLKAKVLLLQQRHDPGFPIDSGLRLREALRAGGHPPQWEMIGPDDAGLLTPAIRAAAYRKIFAFLDQQLGR
jgi:dipeptidyl aminopeptidase/acylaminoacyl peptidase